MMEPWDIELNDESGLKPQVATIRAGLEMYFNAPAEEAEKILETVRRFQPDTGCLSDIKMRCEDGKVIISLTDEEGMEQRTIGELVHTQARDFAYELHASRVVIKSVFTSLRDNPGCSFDD